MNLDRVLRRDFPPVEQGWDARDAALYAVSVGAGSDPLDPFDLPYVYERADPGGLRVLPGFAMTLGWPAFWQDDPQVGIDWPRILHGEQHVVWHRALAPTGRVVARHRVLAVDDKGPGRGAVLHFLITLEDAATGSCLAEIRQVQFLRGDGGCGRWGDAPPPCEPLPAARSPDHAIEQRTTAQAALLYRLASRDWMPIHADPAVALKAGFQRPIAHGLWTLGVATRLVLRHLDGSGRSRLRSLSARFANPGLPGDTIRVELHERAREMAFRAIAVDRGVVLVDRARCVID